MNLMTKITNEYLCPSHGLITGGGHGCGACGKRGMRVASCGGCGAPIAFEPEDLQEPPRELVCPVCVAVIVGTGSMPWLCIEAEPDDPDAVFQEVIEAPAPEAAALAFTEGWDASKPIAIEVRRLGPPVQVRVTEKTERSAKREGTP